MIRLLRLMLAAASAAAFPIAAAERRLEIEFSPRLDGQPLRPAEAVFRTAADEAISVTRLDFLVSGLALRGREGLWSAPLPWQGFVSLSEDRLRVGPGIVPEGMWTAVRFQVGLPPHLNHGDPATVLAGDPLHSEVNGLHWGWQGGYIFFALEGRWGHGTRLDRGFSFHVATDQRLMTVELPVTLDLRSDRRLRLAIEVRRLFESPHPLRLAEQDSTHSREADGRAAELAHNIEGAFSVAGISKAADPPTAVPATVGARSNPASAATPFRLTFSRIFPVPDLPGDNPLTEEGVALGEKLFHDPQLSINKRQACASCHRKEAAFTDSPRRVSAGAEGSTGKRNAMPLFNLAWKREFFWDGRAKSLREQVLQPIENTVEMHETVPNVISKLGRDPAYPPLVAAAFGSGGITAERLAMALEQFLLSRISCDSKLDRAFRGQASLTAAEQRGFGLFFTEFDPRAGQFGADCFHCHGGADFTNHRYANNGLEADRLEPGRAAVTQQAADRGKFAVPTLRNVALTAPYMHDGRFATLEEVIEHYSSGVKRSATLDPNLAKHPEGGVPLSSADQTALVAFLRTLTETALESPPPPAASDQVRTRPGP